MSVTQVIGGLGSFDIKLSPAVPRETMERLIYLGHLCITAGRDDPRIAGDSLLRNARFVGPLRGVHCGADGYTLSGPGMGFWLGDEDGKGWLIETGVVLTAASFTEAITALLPDAIQPGTIGTMPGTITGTFQYVTPRAAIQFVCDTMGAVWQVNGDGTLDAGDPADLYQLDPTVAIVRRQAGADLLLRALAGQAELDEDIEDFTTRVVLYTSNSDGILSVSATADIDPDLNPFKDLFGNPLIATRLSQETNTDPATAPARAQLELNRYSSPRDAVKLSSSQYDITGDLQVGDWVWVFDPDARLTDDTNELMFRGERINPVKLQVNQLTWPIAAGMGLAYRDPDGVWFDLTDYLVPETGDTQITVGGYNRDLISAGGGVSNPGTPVGVNASIPLPPSLVTPFESSVYQSSVSAATRAQVIVAWTQPTNVDGSVIFDGAFYEIRYAVHVPVPHEFQYTRVAFFGGEIGGTHTAVITELTVGVEYHFNVRVADTAGNYSDWSEDVHMTTGTDDIAPDTPAAPEVAGSELAVQVVHHLGLSTGGTFNLPADVTYLEVHAGSVDTFTPSLTTQLGHLPATIGMMQAGIAAVGTFALTATDAVYIKVVAVDEAGNRSGASVAATATAVLIDSAHISDLTVSKVTAGVISSDWLIGANVATAFSGQRAGFDPDGFYAYDGSGTKTFEVDSATGAVSATGTVQSSSAARRVVLNPDPASPDAQLVLYDPDAPDGLTYLMISASGGQYTIARYRQTDDAVTGGIIVFTATDTYYGHVIPGSSQYLKVSNSGMCLTGFMAWEVTSEIATMTYYQFTTAGSVTVNYGATQVWSRVILATVMDTAGSNPAYVTANSATSFTINSPTARSRYFFYQSVGVS